MIELLELVSRFTPPASQNCWGRESQAPTNIYSKTL